ncbi:SDR family NAD(P)-dependent oxidoreductase [Galbibacter mesophilus]|uniref:SDR family NAD(P)-dependent oxidoreductase n=1 Tax=Galbibacter mesophilus TaxID=379069 RepID=UPI00191CB671|nr:SDR family oxidoreductase [Galbibacter mesophilus]MCM5662012.1 SDR family oxidoreductase [Galbibacter mesophilus]
MDLQLKGKKAFISGSTKGIGFAIAKTLADEGAEVVINGRSQESIDKALKKIKDEVKGAKITGIPCDFSSPEEIKSLINSIGSVDILINNVGIFEPKPFEEISDADWQRFYNINVMSGVRLSRAFLPAMKRQDWGRIIFISSESGINIPEEMVHYGMTKTAQLAISRGISETTKGTNVTVNSVLPGPTLSEGVREFANVKEGERESVEKEFFNEARPTSLLQRFAEPQEVANMVAYVASPLSSATNGAALKVDGGIVKTAF